MPSARVATTLRVGVLLLLLVAAHGAAWWGIPYLELHNIWTVLVMMALFVSQPTLLAAWMIVGPGAWWWRWPLCGLSLAGWATYQLWDSDASFNGLLLIFAAVTASVVGAGLVVARLAGIDMVRAAGRRPGPWTFTIRSLLVWTAVIGVGVHLARSMHEWMDSTTGNRARFQVEIIFGICSALVTAAAIWTTMPASRIWWRWGLLAIVAPAAGALALYMAGEPSSSWIYVQFGCVQGALQAGMLLVVRGCGYRLIKQRMCVWQRLSSRIKNQPSAEPPPLPAEVAP